MPFEDATSRSPEAGAEVADDAASDPIDPDALTAPPLDLGRPSVSDGGRDVLVVDAGGLNSEDEPESGVMEAAVDGAMDADVGPAQPEALLDLLLTDLRHPDGHGLDIGIRAGRIAYLGSPDLARPEAQQTVALAGAWVTPAFIDSHVHLAYFPMGPRLADQGVAGVVDLAAPLAFLQDRRGPIRVMASGPMITAVGGYPTRSWGADGYGRECADAAAAIAGVEDLHRAGADLIKIPLGTGMVLPEEVLVATVNRAHGLGLPVAVHALSTEAAALGARVGADVLAHTPTRRLDEATLAVWADRVVVSTLAAFGGADAVSNLGELHRRGATVLYGTDLGNTRTAGIQRRELELLMAAGLNGRDIDHAGTTAPAEYWGFADVGRLAVGASASLLVLDDDPHANPLTLATPRRVLIDGLWRDGR